MKASQRVVPFYFGTPGRELFGCFHEPLRAGIRRCAVLICQPVGHEYINSHRALRQLAARLAEAGFPVLRFDYYGCGDSSGNADQGSITQWLEDISTAIAVLRARTGLFPVYVVGLRLGGTLAALRGVERNDLAGLVLWDPVVNGKTYSKELLSLQKEMLRFRPRPKRRFSEIVLTLAAYADRLHALARLGLARIFHKLDFAFVRLHSESSSLPSVRASATAKLVPQVSGSTTGTPCPLSLAGVSLPDRQAGPSSCSKRAQPTEVLGFPVSNPLLAELEDLDLLRVPVRPAQRVLVVQTAQTGNEHALQDRLGRFHAQVEHRKLEAPQIWLPTADGSLLVPPQVLQSVISWICGVAS